MSDSYASLRHDPGCISECPTCLCLSCQHDNRYKFHCESRDIEIMHSDGKCGCYVVQCSDYYKEEASDHADT